MSSFTVSVFAYLVTLGILVALIIFRKEDARNHIVEAVLSLPLLAAVSVWRLEVAGWEPALGLTIGAMLNASIVVGSGFAPHVLLPVRDDAAGESRTKRESRDSSRASRMRASVLAIFSISVILLFVVHPAWIGK